MPVEARSEREDQFVRCHVVGGPGTPSAIATIRFELGHYSGARREAAHSCPFAEARAAPSASGRRSRPRPGGWSCQTLLKPPYRGVGSHTLNAAPTPRPSRPGAGSSSGPRGSTRPPGARNLRHRQPGAATAHAPSGDRPDAPGDAVAFASRHPLLAE